jgi:hypothetical protein
MVNMKNINIFRGLRKPAISLFTAFVFFLSMYLTPALSSITLGELEGEKTTSQQTEETGKDANLSNPDTLTPVTPPSVTRDEMNPRLVCLLSVIMPGGGHFYLNQDAKGLSFCIAAGIGYTATGYFLIKASFSDKGSTEYKNYLLMTGFLFFMTLIIHFVGIVEAYSNADEINKKNLFGGDSNSDDPYVTGIVFE